MACEFYNQLAAVATNSWSVMKTMNESQSFEIKVMGVRKYIASEVFTVGGHQWPIYIFVDGKE